MRTERKGNEKGEKRKREMREKRLEVRKGS